jgi:hypothetical protein
VFRFELALHQQVVILIHRWASGHVSIRYLDTRAAVYLAVPAEVAIAMDVPLAASPACARGHLTPSYSA